MKEIIYYLLALNVLSALFWSFLLAFVVRFAADKAVGCNLDYERSFYLLFCMSLILFTVGYFGIYVRSEPIANLQEASFEWVYLGWIGIALALAATIFVFLGRYVLRTQSGRRLRFGQLFTTYLYAVGMMLASLVLLSISATVAYFIVQGLEWI